jgi:hypothetical protein
MPVGYGGHGEEIYKKRREKKILPSSLLEYLYER